MRALVCQTLSDDLSGLSLGEVHLPPPGALDVRIAVRAAAIHFPDLLMAAGKYQHRPEPPFVLGGECAGDVIETGSEVTRFKPGDRVMGGAQTGALAEQHQLPESALRLIPDGVTYATAGSFTAAYLTAYVALVRRAQLRPGEWLLIHGATGGVGLAAVDLGKLLGARIIATASTEEKRAFLLDYGADHVLPSSGFREAVKAITGGRGADVIYDPVGGNVFDESVRSIAFGGRLLVVGFASGRIPSLSANMPLIKGFSLVGVRAGEYGRQYPEQGRENIAAIVALLAEGKIRPHIHARLPLDRAVEALELLRGRSVIGKVIVEP